MSARLFYYLRIKTIIRAAQFSDVQTIADFNARIALETENLHLELVRVTAGVAALLQEPSRGTYYVAEVEKAGLKHIAGQLLITYEWSDWRNGNFWWIQSVYVAEEFRGQGVFRALYEHVHSLAKSGTDVCGLRLYMDSLNGTARKAYEKLGLKQTNYQVFELDFVLPSH